MALDAKAITFISFHFHPPCLCLWVCLHMRLPCFLHGWLRLQAAVGLIIIIIGMKIINGIYCGWILITPLPWAGLRLRVLISNLLHGQIMKMKRTLHSSQWFQFEFLQAPPHGIKSAFSASGESCRQHDWYEIIMIWRRIGWFNQCVCTYIS